MLQIISEFKKNTIVELELESIAYGGKAVAHINGFTVFVEQGLPGQKVKARIVLKWDNYAEARIIEVIKNSPFEVAPYCPYFGICGGCLFQNLAYNSQLIQKQQQVKETLKHIGGFEDIEVCPTLASPDIYFYRNKMEYSFSNLRWLTNVEIQSGKTLERDFALGLHVPKYYDKVLDIDQCFLLSERSNSVLGLIRDFARQSDLLPYTTVDHSGFWRFLVIRESRRLNQTMVNLVTAIDPAGKQAVKSLAELLKKHFPLITTVVHTINSKKAQIAFGDEQHVIFGPGYIEELLGEKKYHISANSFFQTNSSQAEKLYQLVLEWGQFQKDQVVYDLYSGTGGIAIFIADQVEKVVGFELIPQSIKDAKVNCEINSVQNCQFIVGDLKNNLVEPGDIVKRYGQPATIIIDPPRSGLHPKLPDRILEMEPEKIIYVSCNPATLARDLNLLCRDQFRIISVQPVDMFPHTAHCEVVVLLERNKEF